VAVDAVGHLVLVSANLATSNVGSPAAEIERTEPKLEEIDGTSSFALTNSDAGVNPARSPSSAILRFG